MMIKRYTGKTVQEAIDLLRAELGNDAVILSTRTIRESGILGFFKKPRYEITAALDKKTSPNNEADSIYAIKDEILELKHLINQIPINTREKDSLPEELKSFHRVLVQNGVDMNISYNILERLQGENNLSNKDSQLIEELIIHDLKILLGNCQPITIGDGQKIVYFVGPTGVGKTTTLAKIASSLVMEQKYKVGLITSDTYRVGAVDQLKIYGEILELPLEVVYNQEDMRLALNKMEDKDILLVDTAGRNHNTKEQIEDLRSIIDGDGDKEVYLLVSAATDIKLLEKLAVRYDFLGDYKIIVTKLDESFNYGSLVNIKYIFDKVISYYTIGQNVPEDIRVVDVDNIVNNLIKER